MPLFDVDIWHGEIEASTPEEAIQIVLRRIVRGEASCEVKESEQDTDDALLRDVPVSAYTLMDGVRCTPEYVWGTVFTWEDVQAVFDETDEEDRRVTMDDLQADGGSSIAKSVEAACMESSHWTEAIRDHITTQGGGNA